VQQFTRY